MFPTLGQLAAGDIGQEKKLLQLLSADHSATHGTMGEACSTIKADYEMPIYSPMHRLNETEILRRNQTSLAAAELYL